MVQNGYRACKKFIIINFEYYKTTIQFNEMRIDIINEI